MLSSARIGRFVLLELFWELNAGVEHIIDYRYESD